LGWSNESDLSDFHELRQEFIPPIQKIKNGLGRNVNETVLCMGRWA